MATIRLIPSTYGRSNTNYVTVTDQNNMYHNTDNTSYASIRGRNSSQTSRVYYCYISGFDFGSVPSNATVTGFSVKIKAYRNSYQRTGESYRPYLASTASSGSTIANTALESDLTTTSGGTVYTFPTSGTTWDYVKSCGSGFTIVIPLNPSSNQYPYVYVYGAEIAVTYTIPVYHTVSASSQVAGVTVSPSSQSVLEGSDAEVTFAGDVSNVAVTDNGVDVTSQLVVQPSEDTVTENPDECTENNFTTSSSYPASNGCTDTSSTTYARFTLASTQHHAIYSFDTSGIPSTATIKSVTCSVKAYVTSTSSSITVKTVQLYAGTTAKGSAYTLPTSNSTFSLSNVGTWTASEVRNIRLRFDGRYSGSSTYYIRFYGANLTIVYDLGGVTYVYTVSDVAADHTILVVSAGSPMPFRVKQSNSWVTPRKVLVKDGGAWKEAQKILVKQNGSWN